MLKKSDCLQSLAVVAVQPGYRKPNIVDEDKLVIVDGRHPMAEAVRPDPFVPNSVVMGEVSRYTRRLNRNIMTLLILSIKGEPRTKIITGKRLYRVSHAKSSRLQSQDRI